MDFRLGEFSDISAPRTVPGWIMRLRPTTSNTIPAGMLRRLNEFSRVVCAEKIHSERHSHLFLRSCSGGRTITSSKPPYYRYFLIKFYILYARSGCSPGSASSRLPQGGSHRDSSALRTKLALPVLNGRLANGDKSKGTVRLQVRMSPVTLSVRLY